MAAFPIYIQADEMGCGPTCIRIISKYYGRHLASEKIRNLSETTREGSSLYGLSKAAEKLGFKTLGAKLDYDQLSNAETPLPCIIHWRQNHFVVLYKIYKNKIYVSDPAQGLITYSKSEFLKGWIGSNEPSSSKGIVLLFEPTTRFYKLTNHKEVNFKGLSLLKGYFLKYKKFLLQLLYGVFAISIIQLTFPFLTQSVIDIGINNRDINFVYLVLFAQLFLFLGKTSIELIRGWILLHLSTRINISLVSDFFIKLMNLPIGFFDAKMTGDILQRINDHTRIENLLTSTSLNVLFSVINLFIFGLVLAWYNLYIFLIFGIGTTIYFLWINFFLKKRRELDYKRFTEISQEQSKVIELINGMQEIKLHNAEQRKRWEWELIQVKIFKVSISNLSIEQMQSAGASFINELKNISITMFSALLVINGNLTLGMMLSISYILGQLNAPVIQLVDFIHSLQDAKISFERISEIHGREDEESSSEIKIQRIPKKETIILRDISFRYLGSTETVLKDINLNIPPNKITAIVGASGSGKTTLMKLLLKFYQPISGTIRIGNYDLNSIFQQSWRDNCGVVMQDGYIFNDTIAKNIALCEEIIDIDKLLRAIEIANIRSFIEKLPLAYNTKIGNEGVGLSMGQQQRILIARAVYKNPKYIFFDEATSSLDANNERVIMNNLQNFFKGRTAIVIAHRLSTVKNADQIVVLGDGRIVEGGTHDFLIQKKGEYYNLVKNQLQLELLNA